MKTRTDTYKNCNNTFSKLKNKNLRTDLKASDGFLIKTKIKAETKLTLVMWYQIFLFEVHTDILRPFPQTAIYSQSPPTADSARMLLDLEKL